MTALAQNQTLAAGRPDASSRASPGTVAAGQVFHLQIAVDSAYLCTYE